LIGFSPAVKADPCAGASPFLDILSSAGYCTEVEWLKNRAIVTGCGGGNYCPTDFVKRSGMAQFMQRLGKALSPEVLTKYVSPGAITIQSSAPFAVHCVTPDSTQVGYPRSVLVNAMFTGLADANPVAWRSWVAYSTNNGTSWNQLPADNTASPRASSAGLQWSGLSNHLAMELDPNKTYRFSIVVARDTVLTGTTGNFADSRCHIVATILNRNGTSSPFDAAIGGGDDAD
jgi:hypothetical protein